MTKNLFKLMAAFVALFIVAACETDTPAPTPNNPNEPNNPETPTSGELAAPVLRVENLKESSFTIAWESVAGAESYTVVLKGDVKQITETSVDFTDMEVGEYTVRVKAVAPKGSELKDSQYALISVAVTGLTSVDWFEQTLYTDTDEENNIYPYNALCVEWHGEGVNSLRYGLFETEYINTISIAEIQKNLKSFSNELQVLEELNSKGVSYYFTDLYGDTSYTIVALVTNEEGAEFMARTEQSTTAATPNSDTEKWLGRWSVTSHETITFDSKGNATIGKAEETFTVTIAASKLAANEVSITGLSTYGEGWATRGMVYDDILYIMSGEVVGKDEDNGYDYIWLSYCSVGGKLGQFFNSSIPSYVLTMDAAGQVSCTTFADDATFSDGSKKRVEVVHTDVYAQDPVTGDIYFFNDTTPIFRAGVMDWKRAN